MMHNFYLLQISLEKKMHRDRFVASIKKKMEDGYVDQTTLVIRDKLASCPVKPVFSGDDCTG